MNVYICAGYALGAPIANLIFDAIGSYTPVLIGLAVIMLVVTLVFQRVLTAAEKEREAICGESEV